MQPRIYQAIVLAKALELYSDHRIIVNRAYKPLAMLRTANRITGHTYRRGQYAAAAQALRAWAERQPQDTPNPFNTPSNGRGTP